MAEGVDLKDLQVDAKLDDDNRKSKEAEIREVIKETKTELADFSQDVSRDLAADLNEKLKDGTLELGNFMDILENAQGRLENGENTEGYINTHALASEKLALQVVLKKLGYYEGPIEADYGEQTYTAVGKFQTAYNEYIQAHATDEAVKDLEPLSIIDNNKAGPLTLTAMRTLPLTTAGEVLVLHKESETPPPVEVPTEGWVSKDLKIAETPVGKLETHPTNLDVVKFTPEGSTEAIVMKKDAEGIFQGENTDGLSYHLEMDTTPGEVKDLYTSRVLTDMKNMPENTYVRVFDNLYPKTEDEYEVELTTGGEHDKIVDLVLDRPISLPGAPAAEKYRFTKTPEGAIYLYQKDVGSNVDPDTNVPLTTVMTFYNRDGKVRSTTSLEIAKDRTIVSHRNETYDETGTTIVTKRDIIPATATAPEYAKITFDEGQELPLPKFEIGGKRIEDKPDGEIVTVGDVGSEKKYKVTYAADKKSLEFAPVME